MRPRVSTNEKQIALCRLLAQALAYPDKHFVANLQAAVGQVTLELFDDGSLPLSALVDELGKLAPLPLDQVQGEHTRLFVSAYPHAPCPPYESAYREGELLGIAAEQVGALYREWGLVVHEEQVDHAGAELEFVAFLLALDTPDSLAAAGEFLQTHLLTWLPRLADDLTRESRFGFYRVLGRLLAAMLRGQFSFAMQSA
ncbi:MAG: molecular chaperone TorD family protein [Chloroflexi bacterium]|nr:molecular chaperone TorD family protein [Chloroflexota bacterium]